MKEDNIVLRLVSSRKFVGFVLCVICASVALAFRAVTGEQFIDVLKWLGAAYIASTAAEDVASKLSMK